MVKLDMGSEIENIQRTETFSPELIRQDLVSRFDANLSILKPQIQENRVKETNLRQRPLVAVTVSLWEEDESMLTGKMFREAFTNLRNQADTSGMDLDFVIVANNGGGKTSELGQKMVGELNSFLEDNFDEGNFHTTTTKRPQQTPNPSTPWNVNLPLSDPRTEGKNRCFFIVQPKDDLNKGKIRALRDVSHAFSDEILNGYASDAVFQMDAETILEYAPTHLTLEKQPFRAMYDALKRRDGVVAIGTKDRFRVIDTETGKPKDVRMPIAQAGMTVINKGKRENFISLPGGAILSEPEFYTAGMMAISEVTYGSLTEDYMLTQLLRDYGKRHGVDENVRINSLNVITHLNRSPEGDKSIEQLLRWRKQGNAVDLIFPELKYNFKPLRDYIKTLIKARLKEAGSKRRFLLESLKDLDDVPGMLRLNTTKDYEDPISGDPTWGRSR